MKKSLSFAIFLILLPAISHSEQYEAIPLRTRSLLYQSSFGIFKDEYEHIIIPRLISYMPGKMLITNLSNLNGETSFQLAYFHRLGFSNAFALSFSRTSFSQDSLHSTFTQKLTDELYGDGENDTLVTVEEDRAEDEMGNPLPYIESSYMEFYAGYGHMISDKVRVGAGFSYIRDDVAEDYNGIEIGGTSFGLYNFTSSTLRKRMRSVYDLINNRLLSYDEETENGTIDRLKDRYFLFGGIDFLPGGGWRLSFDVLLGYGKFSTDGSGVYTHKTEVGNMQVYAESFTSTNSISSYLLTAGTAVEVEKRIGDHVIFMDVGYERISGDLESGNIEEHYSKEESPNLSDKKLRNEIASGKYAGGKKGASTLFSVSVRGIYEGWDRLKFGYGVEYVRLKEREDRGRIDYTYTLNESYDDGDLISDEDDYILTAEAGKSVFIDSYTLTEHLAFPLVILLHAGKGFEIVFGARYKLERVKRTDSMKHLSAIYYYEEKTYGDGAYETGTSLPPAMEGIWPDQNTEFSDYQTSTNKISSSVNLRTGVLYRGIRNLSLSLMFEKGVGDGMKGAIDLSKVFFSVILKF